MILKRIAVCPGRRKGTPVCANVLTVSFTDAAKCEDCTASVGDECMSMENWWNDTDRQKYWHRNVSNSPTLSTNDLTWTGRGVRRDLCGEKPAPAWCVLMCACHVELLMTLNGRRNRNGHFLDCHSAEFCCCEQCDVTLQFQSTVTISIEIRGNV